MLLDEDGTHDRDPPSTLPVTIDVLVLVVGLGPAGARAARAAAQAGARVLAIDRKRVAGQPVQCAEFVPAMIGIEVEAMARSEERRVGKECRL